MSDEGMSSAGGIIPNILPELIFVSDTPELMTAPGSLGVISGSFDPPTNAHLAFAETLRVRGCDRVLLLYSVRTLPKEESPHVPGGSAGPPMLDHEERARCLATLASRREWLAAAVCFESLLEEQAQVLRHHFPSSRLTFGVGSDKLIQIFDPSWYEDVQVSLGRLFQTARIEYALRTGEEEALRHILKSNERFAPYLQEVKLPPDVASISSREVRRRLYEGERPEGIPEEILPIVMRAVEERN